ncbi:TPA: hypothetical protein ACSVZR_003485 [Bacillus cereus]
MEKQFVMYREDTVIICLEGEVKRNKSYGWIIYKIATTDEEAKKYAEECCYL